MVVYRSPRADLTRIDARTHPYLYETIQEMMANLGGGGASYDAYEVSSRLDFRVLEDILARMNPKERSFFANGATEDGGELNRSSWSAAMYELDEFLNGLYEGSI